MKTALLVFIPVFLMVIWFGNLQNILDVTYSYGNSVMISSVPLIRS
ncbi:MAG TPA: hypothetical protein PLT76_03810 [Candidatus Omnitrophota bacterium]|nr:hypothetical protein [Candidatus Omnitrophota bacterium]